MGNRWGNAEGAQLPPFRETVRWYVELWRPLRWVLARLLFLTVLSAALRVALPRLFQPVLDDALANGKVAPALAALILGVGVLRSVVYGLLQFTRASTNFRLGRVARERTFDRLSELGPDVYARHPTGDLIARLTDDCSEEKMAWFACSGVFRLFEASLVILFALVVMAGISPKLTLVALAPLPLITIVYRWVASHLDRFYAGVQSRVSGLEAFLDALFTGIRAVKAGGLERSQADRFESLVHGHRDAEVRALDAGAAVQLLYGYGWQLCLPILVYAGGRIVMAGELSTGAFLSFYALTLMLVFPALDWGEFFVRLRQAGASVARLKELEANAPEVTAPEKGVDPLLAKGLSFDAARKSADGRRTLLDEVRFEVPAGTTVAVVGAVGSGKSTVLKLVPRIMDPRPGRVGVDSSDLREVDLGAWRRKVGYVSQDASLLSATIEENVRLGRDEISSEDLKAACDAARLTQDLAALPAGLATRVGERGATLSGGQRQRVAIARALVHKPDVLVLDDVSAALDADTESALWDQLDRLRPGLTKVVATHRPATIERADSVVVLEKGRVVDQGTHRELLERCSLYREIYDRGRLETQLG